MLVIHFLGQYCHFAINGKYFFLKNRYGLTDILNNDIRKQTINE